MIPDTYAIAFACFSNSRLIKNKHFVVISIKTVRSVPASKINRESSVLQTRYILLTKWFYREPWHISHLELVFVIRYQANIFSMQLALESYERPANDRRLSSWRSPPYFHRRNFRTKRFHLALFTKFVVRMNKLFELRRREANEQFNLVHYAPRIVEDAFYFVSCASRGNLSSRVYGTRVWTSRQFVDNVWPRPIEILPSSTLSRANVGRT